MPSMANDRRGLRSGLAFALASAASFGLSGALARGLLDAGWSAGAVVLARLAIGALVVAPFAVRALRGRWGALRANAWFLLVFGAIPVAGAQFAYFSAVQRMDVGPALLIEYTAPAAVVVWLWLRQGERPGPLTVAGAGLAALGLVLVLDLISGADLAPAGVLWALIAMVCAASYFVLAAKPRAGCRRSRWPAPAWRPARWCSRCSASWASCRCTPRPLAGLRGQRPDVVGAARRCSASSPRGSPTAPGSRPAGGSARACPRSSPCSRSWPA